MGDPDPLVEEVVQARRDRRRVVIIAVVAILVGGVIAIAVTLGAISRTF
ncbi:MAG: hypothetical protein AB7T06_05270 [Kofleriaceae bacterium]